MSELVHLTVTDGLAVLTLDRPPMNALGAEICAAIAAAADECAERDDVRAVIVHGGPKVFAAGADIKEMAGQGKAEMEAYGPGLMTSTARLAAIPKPTMAAITGYALGGGFEVALACDFRIMGAKAKVGLPETTLGVIPGMGGTQRLTRLVGPSRAKELIWSGRFVGAEEALALGIVEQVVPEGEDVLAAATAWMSHYVRGAAKAYAASKACIEAALDLDIEEGLAREAQAFADLFDTEDQKIGMRSFVENGPGKAEFTGR